MTGELSAWVWMLVFLGFGAYWFTRAIGLACPHLTTKQRWLVVFWLAMASNGIRAAWEMGGRS